MHDIEEGISMRIYLKDSRSAVSALARGLATGHTVWCAETGEGWQLGTRSARHARNIARVIMRYHEGHTFFYYENDDWSSEA